MWVDVLKICIAFNHTNSSLDCLFPPPTRVKVLTISLGSHRAIV